MASSDEELFEVERILGEKTVKGKPWAKEYLVKWLGYDKKSDDSWECGFQPRAFFARICSARSASAPAHNLNCDLSAIRDS
jgi:hypothetical protein